MQVQYTWTNRDIQTNPTSLYVKDTGRREILIIETTVE